MTSVVLDADFISSFLKIDRLSLVQDYYRTEILLIPPAVRREVAWTQFSATLENLAWVRVEAPDVQTLRDISRQLHRKNRLNRIKAPLDQRLDLTAGGLLRPQSRLQEVGVAKRPREGGAARVFATTGISLKLGLHCRGYLPTVHLRLFDWTDWTGGSVVSSFLRSSKQP